MKRHFIKLISVLMVVSVLFCTVIPSFAQTDDDKHYPIIYLQGQGTPLYKEKGNPNSEKIYPISIDKDYIMNTVDKLNPVFLKAVITGDYTDYCDVIYDAVYAKFEPCLTDKDGNVTDGSGVLWSWSPDTLTDTVRSDGTYGLNDYRYVYDWRLDPCVIADELNDYINAVMEVTGAEKIDFVSRCLGCNIAAAYLVDYGYDKVNKCVFYASAAEGIDLCNEAFSSEIALDPDSIERYAYDILGRYILEEDLLEFVKTSVSLLNETHGMNLLTDFVTSVYNKVEDNIVPRLLRATIAAFPSYISMTNSKDYENIKKTMFTGIEDEYAGTIEKGDNFHYNVQDKLEDLLVEADETVDFMVIGKYGYQFLPIIESSDEISDGWLELPAATFGGTTAKSVTDVFSDEYINSAKANGTYKYISPDKQVDTSTCLFPDYTWVIKRIEHRNFPDSVNNLIYAFLNFDGQMTINDNADYPQYIVYDEDTDTIFPMTEENNDVTGWNNDSVFKLIFNFIKQGLPLLINLITNAINGAN